MVGTRPSVDELLGDDPDAFLARPIADRWARFFEHFVDALRARPLTIEILAAEVAERNELVAILEAEREEWGERAARTLGGSEWIARPELRGITILLIAGVQSLLVRARRIRTFGGIDLTDDDGWSELKASMRALAERLFGEVPGYRVGDAPPAGPARP